MINAQRTGATISNLRKARDWTQQQLAEKLVVTHQAVSQWEKGATFPDIGILPQLASLLGVTVDDLLNGTSPTAARPTSRGAILEALAHDQPAEVARLVQNDPEGGDMLLDTAPLARPSQLNRAVANMAGFAFNLHQVLGLAPFVSEEALGTLLDQIDTAQLDWEAVAGLAPFLDTERLDQLAQRTEMDAPDWNKLCGIAPFLSSPALGAMLHKHLAAGATPDHKQVSGLAPYLEEAALADLLEHLPAGSMPIEFVLGIAPYVGEAALDRLIARLEKPADVAAHLSQLAPHMGQETLARAVTQAQGQLSAADLVGLAPFLDQETLDQLIRPAPAA